MRSFNKSGNYLFEGWVSRNKSPDIKTENWAFNINEVPTTKIQLPNPSYVGMNRLEAISAHNEKIERETIKIRYHGE